MCHEMSCFVMFRSGGPRRVRPSRSFRMLLRVPPLEPVQAELLSADTAVHGSEPMSP